MTNVDPLFYRRRWGLGMRLGTRYREEAHTLQRGPVKPLDDFQVYSFAKSFRVSYVKTSPENFGFSNRHYKSNCSSCQGYHLKSPPPVISKGQTRSICPSGKKNTLLLQVYLLWLTKTSRQPLPTNADYSNPQHKTTCQAHTSNTTYWHH